MNTIEFENRKYRIRQIEINEVDNRIIASTSLNKKLVSIDGNYKSDEARYIDEQIYFFVDPEILKLNDLTLIKYVNRYCI